MLVKCFQCKEKSEKETMVCVEKGKEKITRRYFHTDCHAEYVKEQKLKEQDLKELDDLYKFLIRLHSIEVLDGRMMEKIQDLRNGSVKINNKKIKKYKQGVPFSLMLDTYKCLYQKIDYILRSMKFPTKWNEFSYVFGTMVNNINAIKEMKKQKEKVETPQKVNTDTVDIQVKKSVKKDDLDISAFL